MGHSSLVGTEKAPRRAKGRDEQSLGPSDLSDTGSDTLGADALPEADPGEPVDVTLSRDQAVAPIEGTGEESDEIEPIDIDADRIIDSPRNEDSEDALPPPRRGEPAKPG